MGEQFTYTATHKKTTGDWAIDGLLAGVLGGVVMMATLVLAALMDGKAPGAVPAWFDPAQRDSALLGLVAHLAVSAIYGAVFAVLLQALGRVRPAWGRGSWLKGLMYGVALFALAWFVVLPAADSPLLQLPPVDLLLGHVAFGLVLGARLARCR